MGKFFDWFAGPEVHTKAEIRALIDAKERYYIQKFEGQVQMLKSKISNLEEVRHRVNQLEALLPRRDAKGHFVKRETADFTDRDIADTDNFIGNKFA